MKKLIFTFFGIIFCYVVHAQYESIDPSYTMPEKRNAITIGVLQGGGSLIGADFEFLVSKKVGFQLGGGYIGFGAGINYHLQPSIRSSFLSLQYWHQGIGDSFALEAVGATFNLRLKKLFSAQLGLGAPTRTGPGLDQSIEVPPMMLLYSIGIYLPI